MWVKYRETDCQTYSKLYGEDSSTSMNEVQCMIDHAKARLEKLKELRR